MKYIANIISKSKKYKFNDLFNVTTNVKEIDSSVPTLIVGTELANTFAGEKLNYYNRQINENTFWTYTTMEKRSSNEEDVKKFNNIVLKNFKNNIKYTYISIISSSRQRIRRLIEFLNNNPNTSFLFSDTMLYISFENNVMGISLDECEYLGINKKKLAQKILKKFKNVASFKTIEGKIDKDFVKNDDILISAMFCYLNS